MDTCFNCGASVRAGAKFCTSCGTRLIDNSAATTTATPEETSWSQAASSGETQVAAPAATPETPAATGDAPEDSGPFATWRSANPTWSAGATQDSSADTSPADRFEAALDASDQTETAASSRSESDFGWGRPAPATDDRFASWSAAYGAGAASPNGTETERDEGEIASVERATIDDAADDVQEAPVAAPQSSDDQDIRQRATTLIEELRELVWKIGEQEPASTGDLTEVRNALSEARGNTPEFADIERLIATVRERPRDIDALVQLGGNAARLEELLNSHTRLTAALDDAISKLQ